MNNNIGVFYSKLFWTIDKQLGSSKASSNATVSVGTNEPQ